MKLELEAADTVEVNSNLEPEVIDIIEEVGSGLKLKKRINDSFFTEKNLKQIQNLITDIDNSIIKLVHTKYKYESHYNQKIKFLINQEAKQNVSTNLFKNLEEYNQVGINTNKDFNSLSKRYNLEAKIHESHSDMINAVLSIKESHETLNQINNNVDIQQIYDFNYDLLELINEIEDRQENSLEFRQELCNIVGKIIGNPNLTIDEFEPVYKIMANKLKQTHENLKPAITFTNIQIDKSLENIKNAETTINDRFNNLPKVLIKLKDIEHNWDTIETQIVDDINKIEHVKEQLIFGKNPLNSSNKKLDDSAIHCLIKLDQISIKQNQTKQRLEESYNELNSFKSYLINTSFNNKFKQKKYFKNPEYKTNDELNYEMDLIKNNIFNQNELIQDNNDLIYKNIDSENIPANDSSSEYTLVEEFFPHFEKENKTSITLNHLGEPTINNRPIYVEKDNIIKKLPSITAIDPLKTKIITDVVSYMKNKTIPTSTIPNTNLNKKIKIMKSIDSVFPLPIVQVGLPSLAHYAISTNPFAFIATIAILNKLNKNHIKDLPKLSLPKPIYIYDKNIKYDNFNLKSECSDDIYKNKNIKLNLEIKNPILNLKGLRSDISNNKFKILDNQALTNKFFKKFKKYSKFMDNNQMKNITFKDYKSNIIQTLNSKNLDNTFTLEELELLETIVPNKLTILLDEVEHQITNNNNLIIYPGYRSISRNDTHFTMFYDSIDNSELINYNHIPLYIKHPIPNLSEGFKKSIYFKEENEGIAKNLEILEKSNYKSNISKLKFDTIKIFATNESTLAQIKLKFGLSSDNPNFNINVAYNLHKLQLEATQETLINHKIYLKNNIFLGGGHLDSNEYSKLLKEYNYIFNRSQIIQKLNLGYTKEMQDIFSEVNLTSLKDIIQGYNQGIFKVIPLPNISSDDSKQINLEIPNIDNFISKINYNNIINQTMFDLNVNDESLSYNINQMNIQRPRLPFLENCKNVLAEISLIPIEEHDTRLAFYNSIIEPFEDLSIERQLTLEEQFEFHFFREMYWAETGYQGILEARREEDRLALAEERSQERLYSTLEALIPDLITFFLIEFIKKDKFYSIFDKELKDINKTDNINLVKSQMQKIIELFSKDVKYHYRDSTPDPKNFDNLDDFNIFMKHRNFFYSFISNDYNYIDKDISPKKFSIKLTKEELETIKSNLNLESKFKAADTAEIKPKYMSLDFLDIEKIVLSSKETPEEMDHGLFIISFFFNKYKHIIKLYQEELLTEFSKILMFYAGPLARGQELSDFMLNTLNENYIGENYEKIVDEFYDKIDSLNAIIDDKVLCAMENVCSRLKEFNNIEKSIKSFENLYNHTFLRWYDESKFKEYTIDLTEKLNVEKDKLTMWYKEKAQLVVENASLSAQNIILTKGHPSSGLPLVRMKLLKINEAIERARMNIDTLTQGLTTLAKLKEDNLKGSMFMFLMYKQNILDSWDRIKNIELASPEDAKDIFKDVRNMKTSLSQLYNEKIKEYVSKDTNLQKSLDFLKAKSLSDLEFWIKSCSIFFKLNIKNDFYAEMLVYLNEHFKFRQFEKFYSSFLENQEILNQNITNNIQFRLDLDPKLINVRLQGKFLFDTLKLNNSTLSKQFISEQGLTKAFLDTEKDIKLLKAFASFLVTVQENLEKSKSIATEIIDYYSQKFYYLTSKNIKHPGQIYSEDAFIAYLYSQVFQFFYPHIRQTYAKVYLEKKDYLIHYIRTILMEHSDNIAPRPHKDIPNMIIESLRQYLNEQVLNEFNSFVQAKIIEYMDSYLTIVRFKHLNYTPEQVFNLLVAHIDALGVSTALSMSTRIITDLFDQLANIELFIQNRLIVLDEAEQSLNSINEIINKPFFDVLIKNFNSELGSKMSKFIFDYIYNAYNDHHQTNINYFLFFKNNMDIILKIGINKILEFLIVEKEDLTNDQFNYLFLKYLEVFFSSISVNFKNVILDLNTKVQGHLDSIPDEIKTESLNRASISSNKIFKLFKLDKTLSKVGWNQKLETLVDQINVYGTYYLNYINKENNNSNYINNLLHPDQNKVQLSILREYIFDLESNFVRPNFESKWVDDLIRVQDLKFFDYKDIIEELSLAKQKLDIENEIESEDIPSITISPDELEIKKSLFTVLVKLIEKGTINPQILVTTNNVDELVKRFMTQYKDASSINFKKHREFILFNLDKAIILEKDKLTSSEKINYKNSIANKITSDTVEKPMIYNVRNPLTGSNVVLHKGTVYTSKGSIVSKDLPKGTSTVILSKDTGDISKGPIVSKETIMAASSNVILSKGIPNVVLSKGTGNTSEEPIVSKDLPKGTSTVILSKDTGDISKGPIVSKETIMAASSKVINTNFPKGQRVQTLTPKQFQKILDSVEVKKFMMNTLNLTKQNVPKKVLMDILIRENIISVKDGSVGSERDMFNILKYIDLDLRKGNFLFSPLTSKKINYQMLDLKLDEYVKELKILNKAKIKHSLRDIITELKMEEDPILPNIYSLDKTRLLYFINACISTNPNYGPKKEIIHKMVNLIYQKPNSNCAKTRLFFHQDKDLDKKIALQMEPFNNLKSKIDYAKISTMSETNLRILTERLNDFKSLLNTKLDLTYRLDLAHYLINNSKIFFDFEEELLVKSYIRLLLEQIDDCKLSFDLFEDDFVNIYKDLKGETCSDIKISLQKDVINENYEKIILNWDELERLKITRDSVDIKAMKESIKGVTNLNNDSNKMNDQLSSNSNITNFIIVTNPTNPTILPHTEINADNNITSMDIFDVIYNYYKFKKEEQKTEEYMAKSFRLIYGFELINFKEFKIPTISDNFFLNFYNNYNYYKNLKKKIDYLVQRKFLQMSDEYKFYDIQQYEQKIEKKYSKLRDLLLDDQNKHSSKINHELELKAALLRTPGLRFSIELYNWFSLSRGINIIKQFLLNIKRGFLDATQEGGLRRSMNESNLEQNNLNEKSENLDKIVNSSSIFIKFSETDLMPVEEFVEYLILVNSNQGNLTNYIFNRSLTFTPNYLINMKILKIQHILDNLLVEAQAMLGMDLGDLDQQKGLYSQLVDVLLPNSNYTINDIFTIPFNESNRINETDRIIYKLLNNQNIKPQVKLNLISMLDGKVYNQFNEFLKHQPIFIKSNIFSYLIVKVEDRFPFLDSPLKYVAANVAIKVNDGIKYSFKFLGVKGNLTQTTIFSDNSYISFFNISKLTQNFLINKGLFLIPKYITKKNLKENKTLLVRNQTQCYFIKEYSCDETNQILHDIYVITGDTKPIQVNTKLSSYKEMLNPGLRPLLQFDFGYNKLENIPYKTSINSKFTLNIDYRIHIDKSFTTNSKIGLYTYFNRLTNKNTNFVFIHFIKSYQDYFSIFSKVLKWKLSKDLSLKWKTNEMWFNSLTLKNFFFEQLSIVSYKKNSFETIFSQWSSVLYTPKLMELTAQYVYMYRNREFIKNINRSLYNTLKKYNTVDKIYAAPYKHHNPLTPVTLSTNYRYILYSNLKYPDASSAYLPKFLFEDKEFRLLKVFANLDSVRSRLKKQLEYYLYLRELRSINKTHTKLKNKIIKIPSFEQFLNKNCSKEGIFKEINRQDDNILIQTNINSQYNKKLVELYNKFNGFKKPLDFRTILALKNKSDFSFKFIEINNILNFCINQFKKIFSFILNFYKSVDYKNLEQDYKQFSNFIYLIIQNYKILKNKIGLAIQHLNFRLMYDTRIKDHNVGEFLSTTLIHGHKTLYSYFNFHFISIFAQYLWSYSFKNRFKPLINTTPSEMFIFFKGNFINLPNNINYNHLFDILKGGHKYFFLIPFKQNISISLFPFNTYLLKSTKLLYNSTSSINIYNLTHSRSQSGIIVLSIQNTKLLNQLVSPSFFSRKKYIPKNLILIPGWNNMERAFWGGAPIRHEVELILKTRDKPIDFYRSEDFKLLGQFDKYDTYKLFYELNFILKNSFSLENSEKFKEFFKTITIKNDYAYKDPNRDFYLTKRDEDNIPNHRFLIDEETQEKIKIKPKVLKKAYPAASLDLKPFKYKSIHSDGIDWKIFKAYSKMYPNIFKSITQISSNIEEYVESVDQTEHSKIPTIEQKNIKFITTKQKTLNTVTKGILSEFYEKINDIIKSDFFSWITFHEYREELLRNQTDQFPAGIAGQILMSFCQGSICTYMVFAADYHRAPNKKSATRLLSWKFLALFGIFTASSFVLIHYAGIDILGELMKKCHTFLLEPRMPQVASTPQFNYLTDPCDTNIYKTPQFTQYKVEKKKKTAQILGTIYDIFWSDKPKFKDKIKNPNESIFNLGFIRDKFKN